MHIFLCLSHDHNDPDSKRSRRPASQTEIACRASGNVAVRLPAQRDSPGCRAADDGGIAGTAPEALSGAAFNLLRRCNPRRARQSVTVVDASALLDVLLDAPGADAAEARLFQGSALHAPHLIDAEITQALRRHWLTGRLDEQRGREALIDLTDFPIRRYPHTALLPRVWELRDNLTAYDAVYVALAEALDAPLVTRDRRLAAAAKRHV